EGRGGAIGTWSAFTAITAGIGPVIGGCLIEQISWRAVFFINVSLAVVGLAISFLRVPESRDDAESKSLDWLGSGLVTLGLVALVYGLIESSRLGFGHPLVISTLVVGGLALTIFLVVEANAREPMLPLTLFRSRDFSGANLMTFFLYTALAGGLF